MTTPIPPTPIWRRVGLPLVVMRVLGQALEFAGFAVLARRLGTADFGRLSVAFLVCRYAGLIGDWGASVRGVRDVAANIGSGPIHDLVRRRTVVTALLVPAYLLVVLLLGQASLGLLAMTIVSRGLNRDWLALGQERGLRSGVPIAFQGTLLLLGSLPAHTVSRGAAAIALGYGAGLVVSLTLNRLPPDRPGPGRGPDGWLLVAVLAEQVTASTDTILLAGLRSASQAGIYAAVYRIPNAWLTVIGLLVAGMVPSTARTLVHDPEALTGLRSRAVRTGLWAGGGVLATIPIAYGLVGPVFGSAYRPGRWALVVLLVATAATAVAAPLHPIYISLARDRRQAGISVLAAGINVVANLIVIPLIGMVGAASTTLLAQVIMLAAYRRGTRSPPP